MLNKLWVLTLLAITASALLAPAITVYDPTRTAPAEQFNPPGPEHLLGTDQLGRDVLSRVLWGARSSLTGAALSTLVALALGLSVGGLAGALGGWIDWILMRGVDVALALPSLLLAMALIAALGSGPRQAALASGIALAPIYSRLVRAAVLTVRSRPFIEAARALGGGRWHIIRRHILPNVAGQAITFATVVYAWSLLNVAALDFLGLGGSPSLVSWGRMLSEGQTYLRIAPWIALAPGLALTLSVLGMTSLGDVWRDSYVGGQRPARQNV